MLSTCHPGNGPEASVLCRDYQSIEEVAEDYTSGALHPKDLKDALALALNKILDPVRRHFETDATAKALLKKVKSYQATR